MHHGRFLGLSSILWRLASVVAVAQFSVSLWNWQFAAFLDSLLEPWQIGVVFAVGTGATVAGYPVSGFISDMIGRKKTILMAFVPMSLGLGTIVMASNAGASLYSAISVPMWALMAFAYGLAMFGWSFVLVMEKAMAADVVEMDRGSDSARTFTMVVAPAFFVDGVAPIVASILLIVGLSQVDLLSMGSVLVLGALIAGPFILRETLRADVIHEARQTKRIPLRRLGRSYWRTIAGVAGFHFLSAMTLTYWAILNVDEWFLDLPTYGLTWSAFSLATAILTYTVGGMADRNLRASLVAGYAIHTFLLGLSAVGSGIPLMFAVNIAWAPSLILCSGAETSLLTGTVDEQHKGRALGVYQLTISMLAVVGMPLGSLMWVALGSLRALYLASALIGAPMLIILWWIVKTTSFVMVNEPGTPSDNTSATK